jgi:hypothetical protein
VAYRARLGHFLLIIEQLGRAREESTDNVEAEKRIMINRGGVQYMMSAKTKCQKIKSGWIPFFPELALSQSTQ